MTNEHENQHFNNSNSSSSSSTGVTLTPRTTQTSSLIQVYLDELAPTGWQFGVAVTYWSRSTQSLYIEPG